MSFEHKVRRVIERTSVSGDGDSTVLVSKEVIESAAYDIPVVLQSLATTTGSATVTCASTAGVEVGMEIQAAPFAEGTKIQSITGAVTLVLTAPASATASGVRCRLWRVATGNIPTVSTSATQPSGFTETSFSGWSGYRGSPAVQGPSNAPQGPTLVVSMTLTSGSATVTMNTTNGLGAGCVLLGVGVAAGATISSVSNTTTAVMSAVATITGTFDVTVTRSYTQQRMRRKFRCPDTKAVLRVLVANTVRYRIWRNGVPLTAVPQKLPNAGAAQYLIVDCGAEVVGEIAFDFMYDGAYPNVYNLYSRPTYPPQKCKIPSSRLIIRGDSFWQGIGSDYADRAMPWLLGRMLGIDDVVTSPATHGGTGWVTDNVASNVRRFGQRWEADLRPLIEQAIADGVTPIVLTADTLNDKGPTKAGTVGPTKTTQLLLERAAFPVVQQISVGPLYMKTPDADMLTLNAECKAAAAAAGVSYVEFLAPTSNPPRYPFNGTGNASSPAGDGNADWACAGDGIHGRDEGYLELAICLSRSIAPLLSAVSV